MFTRRRKEHLRVKLVRFFKKRANKTRYVWTKVNLTRVYTKKMKNSRMGKGKGKHRLMYGFIRRGLIFLEFYKTIPLIARRMHKILQKFFGRRLHICYFLMPWLQLANFQLLWPKRRIFKAARASFYKKF